MFPTVVTHPGVFPRGLVRVAIAQFDKMLAEGLGKGLRSEFFPDRGDIVEIVNERLAMLLYHLKRSTPLGAGLEGGGHLKTAWGAIPAR
jgi:hypothetical protein